MVVVARRILALSTVRQFRQKCAKLETLCLVFLFDITTSNKSGVEALVLQRVYFFLKISRLTDRSVSDVVCSHKGSFMPHLYRRRAVDHDADLAARRPMVLSCGNLFS